MKKVLQMCLSGCIAAGILSGCNSVGTQITWDDKEIETESETDVVFHSKTELNLELCTNGEDEKWKVNDSNQEQQYEESKEPEMIFVDVCGAVNVPGVYEIEEGSRIFEVIALAGGMTEEADLTRINQAQLVSDGMKIRIYTLEESTELGTEVVEVSGVDFISGNSTDQNLLKESENLSDHTKVNLNTADLSLLVTLPGIGESRARDILAYRSQYGSFHTIEEIMNISGIKNAVFDKIKDKIVVE